MNHDTLDISAIQVGLRTKNFSAKEIADVFLRRIADQATLNAFLTVTDREARAAAKRTDERIANNEPLGPLEGVPVAVKDLFVTKGIRTTAASKILDNYVPPYSATAIEKLEGAGAVITGKTNCDEFAMGVSGESSAFGPTLNPWDHTRVPGGSSSGSAAAVAAGLSIAAIGSDTGGSVRQPSAYCGIVGVKPTYGRISRYGMIALASSFDHVGTMGRTVADAATLFGAIAGHDRHDATSVVQTPVSLDGLTTETLQGMRIGLPKEFFQHGLHDDVRKHIDHAVKTLESLGADIREVRLPHVDDALAVYYIILPAEASANLARYDGVRYGVRAQTNDLLSTYLETRRAGFGDEVKRRIMLGTYVLSAGYIDAFYKKAQAVRALIVQDFQRVFTDVDIMFCPTTPTLPFTLGEKVSDPVALYLEDVYTVPANITGLPALSLPLAWERGLPVGGQFIGPHWSESRLFAVASALERALALPLRLP